MKLIAPDYYTQFCCIAGECRHSCCIGWEIEIDDETFAKYRAVSGDFGRRLKEGIKETPEGAEFRLCDAERCAFLNRSGLCDIILNLGEEHLCQICADHPRFRNFYADRTEIGLGLCCEEAARLILSHPDQPELIVLEDDGGDEDPSDTDKYLLSCRDHALYFAQDRTRTISQRLEQLHAAQSSPGVYANKWAAFYQTLEQLDPKWGQLLSELQGSENCSLPEDMHAEAFEQLLVYFIYRHLPNAADEYGLTTWIAFCTHAVKFIRALCGHRYHTTGECAFGDLVEFARMYSSEIEYSDENLYCILDELLTDIP